MKNRLAIIFLFLSLFFLGVVVVSQISPSSKAIEAPTPISQSLSAEKLTALVNNWRVSQGLQPYAIDQQLCSIATDRVDDGEDNHKGLYDKYSDYPYYISENMLFRGTSEEAVLQAWLNSPDHRKALEHPYQYSCIATNENVAVQIFSNF